MNKLELIFQKRPAFIAYITAGHGGLNYSLQAACALIAGGVDILEIGIPFSDPIADGSVIQNAMHKSLQLGTTIYDVLKLVRNIRKYSDVPIILFSYFNPIFQIMGKDFFVKARTSGVDWILIVDLPLEESSQYVKKCYGAVIKPIFIIAPSTNSERIKLINKYAAGFLYYACRKGMTGVRENLPPDFIKKIKTIKKHSHLPVVVGFGISSKSMAQEAIEFTDGFVVGSCFVNAIEQGISPNELTNLAMRIDPRN